MGEALGINNGNTVLIYKILKKISREKKCHPGIVVQPFNPNVGGRSWQVFVNLRQAWSK